MRNELLKKELWDMIRFTNINLDTAFKPFVEIYGLTMMQSRILVAVKECEQATVGTVSKIIDVKSGNGSNMCKKLEQEGFIKRIRSIDDERVVKLILTEKGEETLEKVNNDILKKYGPVLDDRKDEEFEQMIKGIKLLNQLLMEFDKISQP
ncbi:MAG: MarR family transcriptional regulator [Sedimentibacter sp.]|jgi:DNA-binding MarR family transcriptional regulator|nr:MarR family transcriptional regulator [Sedimentibacter sp.]